MKMIFRMFAGGLAWLALGVVLLFGLFTFVALNIPEAHSADSVAPVVAPLKVSDSAFSGHKLSLPASTDGFELFSAPALMSYGLGGLVFLWALSQHRESRRQEGV